MLENKIESAQSAAEAVKKSMGKQFFIVESNIANKLKSMFGSQNEDLELKLKNQDDRISRVIAANCRQNLDIEESLKKLRFETEQVDQLKGNILEEIKEEQKKLKLKFKEQNTKHSEFDTTLKVIKNKLRINNEVNRVLS